MKVQVRETGKIVTLTLMDANGINWAQDFIGNWGALADGQFEATDAGTHLADQETVEWWANALESQQALDNRVNELKEEHGAEAVEAVLNEVNENDLLEGLDAYNVALDEAFGSVIER